MIQDSPTNLNKNYIPNKIKISDEFVIQPISDYDIKAAISSLPNKNSVGSDGLIAKIFKETIDTITKPLKALFNKSLQDGIFPSTLKLAVVTPIFKSGDPSNLSNYRPISVLQTLSKIFEKL